MHVQFEGEAHELTAGESVLECLERGGADIPSSCRVGSCQSCLMRVSSGQIPAAAQAGLKRGWRARGLFLACVCRPGTDLTVERADAVGTHETRIDSVRWLKGGPTEGIVQVMLGHPAGFEYDAGQFVRVVRPSDSVARPYSLASVPGSGGLELHVSVIPGGALSPWLASAEGQPVLISGPYGECTYQRDRPERPLLLAGTGTGLAPLVGVVRDALESGHQGPIRLFHFGIDRASLYLWSELTLLATKHRMLSVFGGVPNGTSLASLEEGITYADPESLVRSEGDVAKASTIYLCGNPAVVHQLRKKLYLAGCSLENIYSDAFAAPAAR